MNGKLQELITSTDGRYFTLDEQKRILAFTTTLPQRFAAAAAVQQAEEAIVRRVVDQMRLAYPNLERFHESGWDKTNRDVQLALRYIAQAMVLDDIEGLKDRLLYWFRTILKSVSLTPGSIRDAYTWLREACRERLPADAFALMLPALDITIEILSDFPEPHVAAV